MAKKQSFIYMDLYFEGRSFPIQQAAANRADMNHIISEATKDGATKIEIKIIVNKTLPTQSNF